MLIILDIQLPTYRTAYFWDTILMYVWTGWSDKEKQDLANELSDVLIYLVRLSEVCHIDLPAAATHKIELNKKKYTADKVYGSSKKYTKYTE